MGISKDKIIAQQTAAIPGKKKTAEVAPETKDKKFDVLAWAVKKYGEEEVSLKGKLDEKGQLKHAKKLRAEYKGEKEAVAHAKEVKASKPVKKDTVAKNHEKRVEKTTGKPAKKNKDDIQAFLDGHVEPSLKKLTGMFLAREDEKKRLKLGVELLALLTEAYDACNLALNDMAVKGKKS